jgi:hypothetical protein
MYIFIFSTRQSETFYILRRIQPDIITNLKKLEFFKKTQILNFMKIRPVGDELLYADGQTARNDETNSRFS